MGFRVYHGGIEESQAFLSCWEGTVCENISRWLIRKSDMIKIITGDIWDFQEMVTIIL